MLKGGVFSLDGSQRIVEKLCVEIPDGENIIQVIHYTIMISYYKISEVVYN